MTAGDEPETLLTAEELIEALAKFEGLPIDLLHEASARREEMVPAFVEAIERRLDGKRESSDLDSALFFVIHLLAEWREQRAYRPIARLMHLPPGEVDAVLGDGITVTLHRVMASVCDGDPEPLFDTILDMKADEFVRGAACEALVAAVHNGRLERPIVERFLRDAYGKLEHRQDAYVWVGWQTAIAMLGLFELRELVERVFKRGFIGSEIMSYEDFKDDLYDRERKGRRADQLESRYALWGDTVEILSKWHGFQEDVAEAPRQRAADWETFMDPAFAPPMPAHNPYRDIGRNDPCPCGSGNKFKKCCLQ